MPSRTTERGQAAGSDVGMAREEEPGGTESAGAVAGRLLDLANGQGPLLAKVSAAGGEMKELADRLRAVVAFVVAERDDARAERERLRRANGELAQVLATQLDTINRFSEGLRSIAQHHPTWQGQRTNTAPNRAHLIEVAFRALRTNEDPSGGGGR